MGPPAGPSGSGGQGRGGAGVRAERILMLVIPIDGKENTASAVTLLPDFPFVPPSAGSGGKSRARRGPARTLSLLRRSLTPQGLQGALPRELSLRARRVAERTKGSPGLRESLSLYLVAQSESMRGSARGDLTSFADS